MAFIQGKKVLKALFQPLIYSFSRYKFLEHFIFLEHFNFLDGVSCSPMASNSVCSWGQPVADSLSIVPESGITGVYLLVFTWYWGLNLARILCILGKFSTY